MRIVKDGRIEEVVGSRRRICTPEQYRKRSEKAVRKPKEERDDNKRD